MKTDIKKSHIKPAKKMFNFNRRSYKRSQKQMLRHLDGNGRIPLFQRLFQPRYNSFFWKGTHNGVFGPGGSTHWEFRSGNLALVIAIVTLIIVVLWILI